jgi:hypothetical protein
MTDRSPTEKLLETSARWRGSQAEVVRETRSFVPRRIDPRRSTKRISSGRSWPASPFFARSPAVSAATWPEVTTWPRTRC